MDLKKMDLITGMFRRFVGEVNNEIAGYTCDDAEFVRERINDLKVAGECMDDWIAQRLTRLVKPDECLVKGQRVRIKTMASGRYTGGWGTVAKAGIDFVKIHLDDYDERLDPTGNCLVFDDDDAGVEDQHGNLIRVDAYVAMLVERPNRCTHFFNHQTAGLASRVCTTCGIEFGEKVSYRDDHVDEIDAMVIDTLVTPAWMPGLNMTQIVWEIVDRIHTDWLITECDAVVIQILVELRKRGFHRDAEEAT